MDNKINWNSQPPLPHILEVFKNLDDESVFPISYSGDAWKLAFRVWELQLRSPGVLDYKITEQDFDFLSDGMALTEFQYGWAVNAVRKILDMEAIYNPAILISLNDEYVLEPCPAEGTAYTDMLIYITESDKIINPNEGSNDASQMELSESQDLNKNKPKSKWVKG